MRRLFTWPLRHKLLTCFGAVAIGISPLTIHALWQPIAFNQFLIRWAEVRYGGASTQTYIDLLRSTWSSGLNIALNRPARTPPPYDDHAAMFEWVFAWVPGTAEVYPTEGYYYFSFEHPDRGTLAASLKLSELDKGYLVLSYFKITDVDAERDVRSVRVRDIDVNRRSGYDYDVNACGRTVRFRFHDESFTKRPPRDVRLLPGEHFAARMHDESGLRFFVVYNETTASFYYLLDEEDGVADRFEPLGSDGLVRGRRTGFAFYDDRRYDRRVLVGVNFTSVKRNDFFDGPGDQVPFRAHLRPLLHRAYPSTMVGAGISEQGILLGRDYWSRYLISAYHSYASLEGMTDYVRDALPLATGDRSAFWTALTKEWWHTKEWRETQYERLEREGKSFERIVEVASKRVTKRPAPPVRKATS